MVTKDVVITQERRSRYAKYLILSIPIAAFPSLRKRILDDEQKFDILLDIQDNPHKPTRHVAADNDVSKTSILRRLKNEKYRPYKINLIQELNDDDPDRRLKFCEIMSNRCQDNPLFIKKTFIFLQRTFVLNGQSTNRL
ncbi:hypothetical protein NQ318_006822 [Aromia moschata]|uniref:Uncharacterized protein n=1 Tax=Aromia moschata TaxID=1265417 RepID=A0AAV8XSZ9_9CUCU|nr:hypothetical protein NQ318_006822 [Aromia moschata]